MTSPKKMRPRRITKRMYPARPQARELTDFENELAKLAAEYFAHREVSKAPRKARKLSTREVKKLAAYREELVKQFVGAHCPIVRDNDYSSLPIRELRIFAVGKRGHIFDIVFGQAPAQDIDRSILREERQARYRTEQSQKRKRRAMAIAIKLLATMPPRDKANPAHTEKPMVGAEEVEGITAIIGHKLYRLVTGGYRQKGANDNYTWRRGGASLSEELREECTQLAWCEYLRIRDRARNRADQIKLARQSAIRAYLKIARTNKRMNAEIAGAISQVMAQDREREPEQFKLAHLDRKALAILIVKLASTKRQKVILALAACGVSQEQIAAKLKLDSRTIRRELKDFRELAFSKLGVGWRRITTIGIAEALVNAKS